MIDLIIRSVNSLIDAVLLVSLRALEIPQFALIIVIIVLAMLVNEARLLIRRRTLTRRAIKRSGGVRAFCLVLLALLLIDRKLATLVTEVRGIRDRLDAGVMTGRTAPSEGVELPPSIAVARDLASRNWPGSSFAFHEDAPALRSIAVVGGDGNPVAIYIALIDLSARGIAVRLPHLIGEKSLTSKFARDEKCIVAINGEAGLSPLANSGLGHWRGNLISDGDPVLLDDDGERPFIGFDRANRAKYFPASIVDRNPTDDKFNCIWGRFDLIRDGVVVVTDNDKNPVTVMGIDETGLHLTLLVSDGRKPGHALGVALPDLAALLLSLGVRNAMTCDGGGSSCLFIQTRGGIVNQPSDGTERPTYTHFGIAERL